jgi:hypothetical protein
LILLLREQHSRKRLDEWLAKASTEERKKGFKKYADVQLYITVAALQSSSAPTLLCYNNYDVIMVLAGPSFDRKMMSSKRQLFRFIQRESGGLVLL